MLPDSGRICARVYLRKVGFDSQLPPGWSKTFDLPPGWSKTLNARWMKGMSNLKELNPISAEACGQHLGFGTDSVKCSIFKSEIVAKFGI
jgi:hypothetical protein